MVAAPVISLAQLERLSQGELRRPDEQLAVMRVETVQRGDYFYQATSALGYLHRISRVEMSPTGKSVVLVIFGGFRVRFKTGTVVTVHPRSS